MDLNKSSKENIYIWLFALIQFTHIVDFVVMMPLGALLMRAFDITPMEFASLVSSYSFSAAIMGVLYGVIADRFDRKKMLLINFAGFIIGTVLCAVSDSFSTLLWGRLIAGCFGGILTSIVYSMVSDLIPFERRGNAMGIVMGAFSFASVIGVPIGLMLANNFGWNYAFWFIVVVSIPVFALSYFIFPKLDAHIEKKSMLNEFKRFGSLLLNMDYLKAYLMILIVGVSSFVLIPFLSPYAVKNVGILETELKYIYLVGGIFTMLSVRVIGQVTDRFGAYNTFFGLSILALAPIYFYTHIGRLDLWVFLTLTTAFMMVVSGRLIPVMTIASGIPESRDRGTFMGLLNSVRALGTSLATMIAGAIISEAPDGKLEHFNKVGYLSIFLCFVAIVYIYYVNKVLKRKIAYDTSSEFNEII